MVAGEDAGAVFIYHRNDPGANYVYERRADMQERADLKKHMGEKPESGGEEKEKKLTGDQ